jgi:hypothetical protein
MRFIVVALLVTVGCGDNIAPAPDASARTCTDAGADDCCRFYPDVTAIAACVKLPAGTCGDVVCFLDCDGNYDKVNVCGPARP